MATSAPQQPKGKICRICGEDCSDRPRTKDRAGNYYCRDCYEKARRKKAARVSEKAVARPKPRQQPTPPQQDDGLALLAKLSEQESSVPAAERASTPCESCGAPIPEGAKLCARCGYDRTTGRRTGAAVAAPSPTAPSSRGGGGFSFSVLEVVKQPWFAFVAPAAILGLLFMVAKANEDLAILYLVLESVFSWTIIIFILVQAFRESLSQGFLCLCVPCYIFYFVFFRLGNPYVTSLFVVSLLGSIGSVFVGGLDMPSGL